MKKKYIVLIPLPSLIKKNRSFVPLCIQYGLMEYRAAQSLLDHFCRK